MIDILKWTMSIIGHLGFWSLLHNRVHATAWHRLLRKRFEKVVVFFVVAPMIWVLYVMIRNGTIEFEFFRNVFSPAYWYGTVCILLGGFFVLRWVYRKAMPHRVGTIASRATEMIQIRDELEGPILHGTMGKLFAKIPWNQATSLSIEHRTFAMANFPARLDGLRICQISDLHFLGQLDRRYFERVVQYANAFQPDLILITGDICDSMKVIDWIESVLGELRARHGMFYVLGNHDQRIPDEEMLRGRLEAVNIRRAGGRWVTVRIDGCPIHIAGNELPWYRGAEELPLNPPESADDREFRILMTHTPDQIDWARPYRFDLALAGHTHGGQIRLPVVGPVIAPSKYGVKYCSGTFEFGPTTMHVSRGLSGDESIRINCPPELGCFTFRSIESGGEPAFNPPENQPARD